MPCRREEEEEAEGEEEEEDDDDSLLLLEQSVTLGGSGEVDRLVAQIGETLQLDAAQDSPASPCAPPGPPLQPPRPPGGGAGGQGPVPGAAAASVAGAGRGGGPGAPGGPALRPRGSRPPAGQGCALLCGRARRRSLRAVPTTPSAWPRWAFGRRQAGRPAAALGPVPARMDAGLRRLPPPAAATRASARSPHRRRRPAPAPAAARALGEPHQGGCTEASFATAAVARKASPTPAPGASVGPSL
uniref:Uncharacterized protein n=1 Tax=Equus asinus TaxID=9793 RepID=A0A9L0J9Z6_EQUAS